MRKIILYSSWMLLLFFSEEVNAQHKLATRIFYRGDSVLTYPADSVSFNSVGLIPSLPDGVYYAFALGDTSYLTAIIPYVNKQINGEYKQYFTSTKHISARRNYKDGKLDGHWTNYQYSYPDKIEHEGDYKEDKKIGFQYSYSGETRYNKCFYDNDRLVYDIWENSDSTVYYEKYARKYFLYPKSKCDSSGGILVDDNENGLWRYYHPNGNLKAIGEYENGRKKGSWKEYYENGKPASEYICDSKKEGSWVTGLISQYDSLGNKLDAGNFKDGVGKFMEYDGAGTLRTEEFYSAEDCPEYTKSFSADGILIKEEHYKNCKKEGAQKRYYYNGKLQSEINYKKDKLNGICTSYYPTGAIKSTGIYKNVYGSLRYNLWLTFTRNRYKRYCGTGRQLAQHMQGKWVEYDSLGKYRSLKNYKYGEQHGATFYYYPNGQIKTESNYKNGLENGNKKEYTEQGTLIKITKYHHGNKKEELEYTSDGKLKSRKKTGNKNERTG